MSFPFLPPDVQPAVNAGQEHVDRFVRAVFDFTPAGKSGQRTLRPPLPLTLDEIVQARLRQEER